MINGTSFSMVAFSGGGRGSTGGMELLDLKHWSSAKKAPPIFSPKDRGGPLPVGLYIAKYYGQHEHLGRCAELMQTLTSLLHADPWSEIGISVTDRSGFFIHGSGPKGSDGCIVPAKASDLKDLLDAIESADSPIALEVFSEGMNADKLEGRESFKNIA
ncbi:MAG TPA: hypothetical protein PLW55_18925 [Leptospiraceae bacterium]|nr:hypothetical protein [Leptospiraceae bacterium]